MSMRKAYASIVDLVWSAVGVQKQSSNCFSLVEQVWWSRTVLQVGG
jgi:hypothetical protein